MKEDFIQLNDDSILRLRIKDKNGNETGEMLTFDLEDIELFLRYQELVEEHKKNVKNVQNQLIIINKRQDVKGKKLLSKNEEDNLRALNEFFKKEEIVYNKFLGENGVKKLLNGRKLGWFTMLEIDDIIEKQIFPYFEKVQENFKNKIKAKYGNLLNKNINELKIDE